MQNQMCLPTLVKLIIKRRDVLMGSAVPLGLGTINPHC